jgi:hypothetical protein
VKVPYFRPGMPYLLAALDAPVGHNGEAEVPSTASGVATACE